MKRLESLFGFAWLKVGGVAGAVDYASICLLVGYPLFVFLLLSLPTTDIARDFFLVVFVAYAWLRKGRVWIEFSGLNVVLMAAGGVLIAYCSSSGSWSSLPRSSESSKLLHWGMSVGLFWLASCLYFSRGGAALRNLCWAICVGLLGNLLGAWIANGDIFPGNRLTGYGVLNNPILLASVGVVQIAIGLHLQLHGFRERLAGGVGLIFCLAVVMLSGSRGPMLAMAAVAIVWFICFSGWRPVKKIILATAAGFGIGAVFLAVPGAVEVLTSRGVSYRPAIWQQTLVASQQHLYFGWGWGNEFNLSPVADSLRGLTGLSVVHPHGLLISSLYYGGGVGLLLLVAFLCGVIREVLQAERRGFAIGLIASVLLLTATDTHSVVTNRGYVWLIFWMPIAILLAERKLRPARKTA